MYSLVDTEYFFIVTTFVGSWFNGVWYYYQLLIRGPTRNSLRFCDRMKVGVSRLTTHPSNVVIAGKYEKS